MAQNRIQKPGAFLMPISTIVVWILEARNLIDCPSHICLSQVSEFSVPFEGRSDHPHSSLSGISSYRSRGFLGFVISHLDFSYFKPLPIHPPSPGPRQRLQFSQSRLHHEYQPIRRPSHLHPFPDLIPVLVARGIFLLSLLGRRSY